MGTTIPLNIFITASPLTTSFMVLWQKAYPELSQGTNIIATDILPINNTQLSFIREIVQKGQFEELIENHIQKAEGASFAPSLYKVVIRKIKTVPGFKQVYDFLFGIKKGRENKKNAKEKLAPFHAYGQRDTIRLYACPQSVLLQALKLDFPDAEVHYFEHGVGDYIDVAKKLDDKSRFYCVLKEGFEKYCKTNGMDGYNIFPAFSDGNFSDISIGEIEPALHNFVNKYADRKGILLMMQVLERYSIPDKFWFDFLDQLIAKEDFDEGCYVILKPHPIQDPGVVANVVEHLNSRGIPVYASSDLASQSLNVEFLFSHISDHIDIVASPFSSSIFYVKELYPRHDIRYFWGIDLVLEHAGMASPLYQERWRNLGDELLPYFGEGVEKL